MFASRLGLWLVFKRIGLPSVGAHGKRKDSEDQEDHSVTMGYGHWHTGSELSRGHERPDSRCEVALGLCQEGRAAGESGAERLEQRQRHKVEELRTR